MAEGKGCRKQLERLKLFLPPRASKVALKNFFYLEGGGGTFYFQPCFKLLKCRFWKCFTATCLSFPVTHIYAKPYCPLSLQTCTIIYSVILAIILQHVYTLIIYTKATKFMEWTCMYVCMYVYAHEKMGGGGVYILKIVPCYGTFSPTCKSYLYQTMLPS